MGQTAPTLDWFGGTDADHAAGITGDSLRMGRMGAGRFEEPGYAAADRSLVQQCSATPRCSFGAGEAFHGLDSADAGLCSEVSQERKAGIHLLGDVRNGANIGGLADTWLDYPALHTTTTTYALIQRLEYSKDSASATGLCRA